MTKPKILFVQLPHLDNDVQGQLENVPLAASYLTWSMENSNLDKFIRPIIWHEEWNHLDDAHLVRAICSAEPSVIVATVYVWNVERTMTVLHKVKEFLSSVQIWLGGPEVAKNHPFLLRNNDLDAMATGEGEQLFPSMVRHFLGGSKPQLVGLAWRQKDRFVWGTSPVPRLNLSALLPPPGYRYTAPDSNGVAYMETSRGCPLHCMFCCYNQRRTGVSFINADEVALRVKRLMRGGAREIRFIDPTFNSNPEFDRILGKIAQINRRHSIAFFAELRAETITPKQASLLSAGNFTDIEVGVQSLAPEVLSTVRRHTSVPRVRKGVELLADHGIRLTIDIMNGLPVQDLKDLKKSLKWANSVQNSQVQFLHTLLIPGTELRDKRRQLGLVSQPLPPYRVIRTAVLSNSDMLAAEQLAEEYSGSNPDCPTMRFVGTILPDLFPERVSVQGARIGEATRVPGKSGRRCVIIEGRALILNMGEIAGFVRAMISSEPHILWQFVLAPVTEEPLDLIDAMVEAIDEFPTHFLDRMTVTTGENNRVARRVFVQLDGNHTYSRDWSETVTALLEKRFY